MRTAKRVAAFHPNDRDRVLWINVILAAVRDATIGFSGENAGARARDQRVARAWFRPNNPDFIEVCHLAGMDPTRVHKQATDAISKYDETGQLYSLGKSDWERTSVDA